MHNRLKNKRLFFLLVIFSMVGCQNAPINNADDLPAPTPPQNTTDEKGQSLENQSLEKGRFGGPQMATSKRQTRRTCWDRRGRGRVFILAVGSNTDGLTETNRDAARFAKAMRELFRVPRNRVCVLTNVYKKEFVHALERLGDRRRVGADDLVIIFYSGHGCRLADDNNDETFDRLDEFFVTYDEIIRTKNWLRDDEFSVLIRKIPTRHILTFIDACFSAGLVKGKESQERIKSCDDVSGGRVGATLDDPIKGVLLSAAEENQPALELPKRGGRFTVFFLKALKRARQKRQPVDLLKVFKETRKNVYQHSKKHSKKAQMPVKKGSDRLFRQINGYIP